MAAEKLTKGRLVQIIIMLLILVVAFTWRTLTHSDITFRECNTNACTFSFDSNHFSITEIDDGYLLSGNITNYELVLLHESSRVVKQKGSWKIETNETQLNILLTSKESNDNAKITLIR